MEAYEYVVKNNQNETEKGLMWGDSEQEIAIRLKRDGYRIYRMKERNINGIILWW